MDVNIDKYIITLDNNDQKMVNERVAEKGVKRYLAQQLIYLDCSRVINGRRMMQTIGYPYARELSNYMYVIEAYATKEEYDEYLNNLIKRHNLNLEYEKDNPPIIYGKTLKKLPRKRNTSKPTTSKKTKSTLSNNLKTLAATFTNLKFNIKIPKNG